MYRQVKFIDAFDDRVFGGIGIFEDGILVYVLCGECGGLVEAEDIVWYKILDWVDISDAIIGED